MNTWTTGIIGRASAIRINYQKWAGPSINTTDPSHSEFKFGIPPLLDFGAIAFQAECEAGSLY